MFYTKIETEIRDQVGTIRMNDPAKLNAVNKVMVEEINDALDQFSGTVRAVILTGNGRAFCAGGALNEGLLDPNTARGELDLGVLQETHINPLMSRLRGLTVPWITAVRGAAAGVGASFALAGDLVIASETAYFLQAFARIALVPDGGSTYLLTRSLSRVRAMELMLLADRLPAQKALEWGLINRVVADEVLEEEAFKIASQLAHGPTATLGLIRKATWEASDGDWDSALTREREMQKITGRTQDCHEGIAAFNEKRAVRFIGK